MEIKKIISRLGNVVFAIIIVALMFLSIDLRGKRSETVDNNEDKGVFLSSPKADNIIGFSGPIPLEIVVNPSNNKISSIKYLPNSETEIYWQQVLKANITNNFIGLTPKEALKQKVDAVTGATLSSVAAIDTINFTLNRAAGTEIKAVDNQNFLDKILSPWYICVLIFINLIIFFVPIKKEYRIIQLIVNISVFGILSHFYLSMAQVIGWMNTKFQSGSINILALFILVIFLALIKGKNFYCTQICPFGAAQELSTRLGQKIKLKTWNLKYLYRIPIRRIILNLTIIALLTNVIFIPFEPFPMFQFRSIVVSVIGIIFIILSMFVPRVWCRSFCPLGALLDFFCKISNIKKGEKK